VYKAKKRSLKQVLLHKKENIKIKFELILIIIDIKNIIKNVNKNVLKLSHKYIVYPIFGLD
jgi:hypothetical protein